MSFPPPPFGTLWEIATSYWLSRCLHVATELGVADALGPEPESADALAKKVGANPDALYRVIRLLASHGVFDVRDGTIGHSPASQVLRADNPQSMRGFVRIMAMPIMWDSYGTLEHTVRTGEAAADFFAYMETNPGAARIFDDGMTAKAHAQVAGIIGSYDFAQFSRVADVGGGRGHLLKAVLEVAPKASGVLFDQPRVVAEAKGLASERLQLQAGDFFKDGMPTCDAYVLMQVLHDWDDESVGTILAAIRKAAPPAAKLLVIETILPEDPGPHWAKLLDIQMLTMHTGRERTRAEYTALLGRAQFRLERVVETRADVQILEAVRA